MEFHTKLNVNILQKKLHDNNVPYQKTSHISYFFPINFIQSYEYFC